MHILLKILFVKNDYQGGFNMNLTRAKEIASSQNKIDIRYNGKKVIIEKINADNGIAHISYVDNPNKKDQVSITNLEER